MRRDSRRPRAIPAANPHGRARPARGRDSTGAALSEPALADGWSGRLFVLSAAGALSILQATDLILLNTQTTSTGSTDLTLARSVVPSVVVNEVQAGAAGWVEVFVSGQDSVDFAGINLVRAAQSYDLSGLGQAPPGSVHVICSPSTDVTIGCDVTVGAPFEAEGGPLTLERNGDVIDVLQPQSGVAISARRHPALDGRLSAAVSPSVGTPGAANSDIFLP